MVPLVFILSVVLFINLLQKKSPHLLPVKLQTWTFLPIHMRSLKPYDTLISKYLCFMPCCKQLKVTSTLDNLTVTKLSETRIDDIHVFQLKDKKIILELIDF